MNYKNYFRPTKSETPSYNKTNLSTLWIRASLIVQITGKNNYDRRI